MAAFLATLKSMKFARSARINDDASLTSFLRNSDAYHNVWWDSGDSKYPDKNNGDPKNAPSSDTRTLEPQEITEKFDSLDHQIFLGCNQGKRRSKVNRELK
jgi:hypothetical protein